MAIDLKAPVIALCLLVCAGCTSPRGLLYTRTTVPHFLPRNARAPKGEKCCKVDITQLKEPLSQANLTVIWTSRAVAEATSGAGMTELRYVDIETLSILNSLYERRRLIFYGD